MSDGSIIIDTKINTSGIERDAGKLRGVLKKTGAALGVAGKVMAGAIVDTERVSEGFENVTKAAKPLSKTIFSLGNMFRLMVLRMAIRGAIKAVQQGFKDLAVYSAEFNRTMSALSTSFMEARNSLATAFAPALQAITPLIISATNAVVNLVNALGMIGARVFSNAATFTKAKKAQVDYAKAVGGTNKAMGGQLAAFDELNVLSQDSGGGGVGSPLPSEMFEEVEIPENLVTISDKIKDTFGELVRTISPAKVLLSDFYNTLLKPIGEWGLGTGWPKFVELSKAAFNDVNWAGLRSGLVGVWAALAPFAIHVGEGLLWFYENVLLPLGLWQANEVFPRFMNIARAAIEMLNMAIDKFKPAAKFLFDNFLLPIARWTGGVILDVLDLIGKAFDGLTRWIKENGDTINKVFISLGTILAAAWQKVIKPTLDLIWNAVKYTANMIGQIVFELSTHLAAVLGGLVDFIAGVLTGDWTRAWEGLKNIVKGVFNTIVLIVETGVNLITDAINFLIGKVNAMTATFNKVPGVNIPMIPLFSRLTLPRLATGAVIPPNSEFLAVLGDQKSGRNIETPEGLLREIMQEELAGIGGDITINFTGSLSQLARILKPEIEREDRRRGGSLITGGVLA